MRLSTLKQSQKYYQKHKEEYNEASRKRYKKNKYKPNVKISKYRREMREVAKELGNCSICFKPKDNPKYSCCLKCRMYQKEYYHKNKNKNGK